MVASNNPDQTFYCIYSIKAQAMVYFVDNYTMDYYRGADSCRRQLCALSVAGMPPPAIIVGASSQREMLGAKVSAAVWVDLHWYCHTMRLSQIAIP
jgi:hypothetical protein